ncbi:hypothetical protein ABZ897_30370 [Nonomuraea sp. NPDC046802]|uniref:hypothetical protein n=1 Tax=Nonomuraea sp. NPDC046802 TaxID=3154919 RepID=UPI00340C501D
MRTARAVIALAMGAVLAAGIAPAAHADAVAYPRTYYSVQYGNSYVKGNLIWYNQSIEVGGSLRAASGCRSAVYTVYGGSTILSRATRTVCEDTVGHGFTLPAKVRGGATEVVVDLYENGARRDTNYCDRAGCHTYEIPPA